MEQLKLPQKRISFKWLIIFIILTLIFLVSLFRGMEKTTAARRRVAEAEEKLEKLENETKSLEEQLNEVKSDAYIDRQLRDKLGLIKEGEVVIVLPDEDILRSLAPKRWYEEEETLPDPNWKKWMKLFLN